MIWTGTVAMRTGMAQVCLPVKRHSEIERESMRKSKTEAVSHVKKRKRKISNS